MAQGDSVTADVVSVIDADTLLADITSGSISGERWRVRLSGADVWEPEGPSAFLGIGGRARTIEYVNAVGRSIAVAQDGVDQFGRLVGFVSRVDGTDPLGALLRSEGWSTDPVRSQSGGTLRIAWPDRRPGFGFGGDLVVDTTQP